MEPNSPTDADLPEPLVLEGVSKRYGRGPDVLHALSHTFAPGTATGLVGPNGSGKTTLLRLLSATAYPTSGHVRYGNLDVHAHPYRYLQHVGIVDDEGGLPEHLSAEEMLEYVLRARGRWSEARAQAAAAILDRLDLDERRATPIGTYSSGMLKKTQIAVALAPEPAVLLLDEPLRGLDDASRAEALGLFEAFKARGGLLLIASHLGPAHEALCDATLRLSPAARPQPL
jgi:ABC-2 type transport system ATP-binding protein